jgi:hypothetical protein
MSYILVEKYCADFVQQNRSDTESIPETFRDFIEKYSSVEMLSKYHIFLPFVNLMHMRLKKTATY